MIATKIQTLFETAKRTSSAAVEGLSHLLWPARCSCCSKVISKTTNGLCHDCWEGLLQCTGADYCARCGRDASKYAMLDGGCARCDDAEIFFDGIARAGIYDKSLRDMILAFKFNDRTELDARLWDLLNAAFAGSNFRDQIDLFVPVPLHWARRIHRGFNQSYLLCKGLKGASGRINTELVRIRHTERQWNLSLNKRRNNVEGAFAVRNGHGFAGKSICLVDDITTTRATLDECSRALKAAGAQKVFALVAAVAMQELDS